MQNFFSLIKTAAPAIYSYKHIPKGENVPLEIAKRFFVFLQRNEGSPNQKGTQKGFLGRMDESTIDALKDIRNTNPKTRFFFHGTNSAAFGKMFDHQLMKSPESALAWQGEARPGTQQLLYFSQNKGTCDGYSSSRAISGTVPVTLALKIPLCAIAEVRTSIFRPFVNSPYHPNEAGHQQNLSTKINPFLMKISERLAASKSKSKRKEIEKEMFSELLQELNNYFDANHGEFTITHGVPLRYMQNVFFRNELLGCKSYTQLNKKLEENETSRKDFLNLMSEYPSVFSLLSPHQQNYKTAKIQATKAWFNKVKSDPQQIFWIPESFLTPTQNPEFTFPDKNDKKQSLHSLVNYNIIPTLAENGKKTTNVASFSKWLGTLPKITHANPLIAEIIKEKMLKFSEEDADAISKLCGYLSSNFWGDGSFIDTCIEKIWPKASTNTIEHIWRAEYSCTSYDDFPLINKVAHNQKAMLFYFSRAELKDIKWNRFPVNVIEPFQKELKEIIASKFEKQGSQSVDSILSLFSTKDSVHGNIPKMLTPPDMIETCLNSLIQRCKEDINSIVSRLLNLPDFIKNNSTFKTALKESLKENILSGSTAWRNVLRVYPEFSDDPELQENKNSAIMLDTSLQYIKYETLTDKQKEAYAAKAKDEIESNYKIFQFLPDHLKNDAKLLESYANGFLESFKYNYYMEIPIELKKVPNVLEKCLKIKIEEQNYTDVSYEDVKKFPSLIKQYINKICDAIRYDPNSYNSGTIPEELKTNEEILKSLSRGIAYYAILENDLDLTTFPMDLLEKFKNDRYEYILDEGYFKKVPYDLLTEELKLKYKSKLLSSCSSNTVKYLEVDENSSIKNDPEVIKSLSDGYVYEIKWNGNCGLPSTVTQSEAFKAHHKEINKKLFDSGKFLGVFYSAIETDEEKLSYKKIVSTHLSSNPSFAKNLEKYLLTDPLIIESLTKGIGYYISLGYFEQASEIADIVKEMPEYTNLQNTINEKSIAHYMSSMDASYPIRTLSRMSHVSEAVLNNPDLVNKICEAIENINKSMSGLYSDTITGKIEEFKEILKDMKMSDENKQKLLSSLSKRAMIDSLKAYYNYPGDWSGISDEEKNQLSPMIVDAFISFYKDSAYIDDMINKFQAISKYFSKLPDFNKFKQHVIQILQNKKAKMSNYDKNYYHTNVPYYTTDQDIINLFLPSVNDMVNEIDAILSHKSDPYLMSALSKLKTYVKYKDTPEYEKTKEKIIDQLVIKVQESKSLNIKKQWCTILSENFPGHAKLNVCTTKQEPTLFDNIVQKPQIQNNPINVQPTQNTPNQNLNPKLPKSIAPPLINAPVGLKNKLQLKKEKYNNMFTLKDNPQKTE